MEETIYSVRQERVLFSINIPGQSLSFAQYQCGISLVWLSLPKRCQRLGRVPFLALTLLAFGLWVACSVLVRGDYYQLTLLAWAPNDECGDHLFELNNMVVIALLMGCCIVGALSARYIAVWRHRLFMRAFYDGMPQLGYCLKVTELGIHWVNDHMSCYATWDLVKGVVSRGEIDYIHLGSRGFLWIPADLPDYPREQMLEFIKKHL